MKSRQYTIRNIPEPVDAYLRRRSKLSGKSLNEIVIEELSDKVNKSSVGLVEGLSWFIGSGIDDQTLGSIQDEDKEQKQLINNKGY